jgi:voltage-gated potassium channel
MNTQFINNSKKFIYKVLSNTSKTFYGKIIEQFLLWLIISNVLLAILGSVQSIHARFSSELYYFEFFSVIIFFIEYILRLWTTDQYPKYKSIWQHAKNPMMIFDILVILPFLIISIIPILDTRILKIFRLIRILRVFRLKRYSIATEKILRVVNRQKEEIIAVFFLMFIALLVSSTCLYIVEHEAQPDTFSSIPATLWWGIATLSTIGYGDMVPITTMGKLLATITAFFGVAIFALPTGILGASFYQEISAKNIKRIKKLEKELARIKQFAQDEGIDLSKALKKLDKIKLSKKTK